jgi:FixJ family two-component response regulator
MTEDTVTLFVVDDDESVRRALRRFLKSVGFEVEVFDGADEFLSSGRLGNPGCLILDVKMPAMGGLELQRHLAGVGCTMPVIFITAHEDEEARSCALRGGAVDFLLKPFNDETLLRAIDKALCRLEGKQPDDPGF